jgi:hypothetical protein
MPSGLRECLVVKSPDNEIVLLDEAALDLIDFSVEILGFIQMIVERGFVNDNQVLPRLCRALANVQSSAEGSGDTLNRVSGFPALKVSTVRLCQGTPTCFWMRSITRVAVSPEGGWGPKSVCGREGGASEQHESSSAKTLTEMHWRIPHMRMRSQGTLSSNHADVSAVRLVRLKGGAPAAEARCFT